MVDNLSWQRSRQVCSSTLASTKRVVLAHSLVKGCVHVWVLDRDTATDVCRVSAYWGSPANSRWDRWSPIFNFSFMKHFA